MDDTLLAPEGTIAEPDAEASSEQPEQMLEPEAVETDTGEPTEETEQPTDPLAVLSTLTPEQLRELDAVKKLLETETYKVRQSEADKAKHELAKQDMDRKRQAASAENRNRQAAMAIGLAKHIVEEGRDPTVEDIQSILRDADAHSYTTTMFEAAQDMTAILNEMYPDWRPDANDAQAFNLAVNSGNAGQMGRVIAQSIAKAAAVKAGIDERTIRADERAKVLAEREKLAADELATKNAKKAAADRNDPTKQPTRINGTSVAPTRFKTQAEFNKAMYDGTIKAPSNVPLRQWIDSQTKGLPAR